MQTIEQALEKLSKSKFRRKFQLKETDFQYIERTGMETVRRHAAEFVKERLSPAYPKNDGKQTPMKGHPVFIAQHATACCCRGCLNKWYGVKMGQPLSEMQQQKIVNLLIAWIQKQLEQHNCNVFVKEQKNCEKIII
ncbi:DUF4186 domain-containing protein [Anaerotignum sp.]|uniref:DUF4186 domain-containing protein n=1 Tax=Anaerotignum sp. TaxID=2039241 RepID=UPI0037350C22